MYAEVALRQHNRSDQIKSDLKTLGKSKPAYFFRPAECVPWSCRKENKNR